MSELFLLESGEVVQSFSGVDYNVLGYIPPFPKDAPDTTNDRTTRSTHATTTNEGDVFINRMAEIQTMSISSVRDHKAARRLGSSWAFDFSRGARTVAGSLVFAMLDGDAFRRFIQATSQYNALSREDADTYQADAIPPFNIIFTATNESGRVLVGLLTGIRLTNTGMSFGIHDIYTEQVYSFVAERYEPLNDLSDKDVATKSAHNIKSITRSGREGDTARVDAFQSAIRKTYNGEGWRRPRMDRVDEYTRNIVESRVVIPPSGVPSLQDNHYMSPSDRRRKAARNSR